MKKLIIILSYGFCLLSCKSKVRDENHAPECSKKDTVEFFGTNDRYSVSMTLVLCSDSIIAEMHTSKLLDNSRIESNYDDSLSFGKGRIKNNTLAISFNADYNNDILPRDVTLLYFKDSILFQRDTNNLDNRRVFFFPEHISLIKKNKIQE
jgi:hypothetical protein